jgi:phenylacetic acid degradation operon negative regulatory protein
VLAPAATLSAHERRDLRKELGWEGFGSIASGVFVRPARGPASDTLAEILGTLRLDRRVTVLSGRDLPGPRGRSLRAHVGDCWDLSGVAAEYRRFLARFAAVSRNFRERGNPDPEQCFIVRSLLIHAFRRVTLHDPQLPPELLPPRWPAAAAYALCRDFYRLAQRGAEQHLVATLSTDGGALRQAAPYFYRRFGGLKTR